MILTSINSVVFSQGFGERSAGLLVANETHINVGFGWRGSSLGTVLIFCF